MEPSFVSEVAPLKYLMEMWMALTRVFPGWSLTEVKELSARERSNWLGMAADNLKG